MQTDRFNKVMSGARILPLFYHSHTEACLKAMTALANAGVPAIEFTQRGPQARYVFEAMIEHRNQHYPDLLLGVGTITHQAAARSFHTLGADFLVSPCWIDSVAFYAQEANVLWIPGCMTPTEIHRAVLYGFEWIKLFPGEGLSPDFLKSVRPIFPKVRFLVTGGVEAEHSSIQRWLDAGATAVGLGSKLIPPAVWENQAFDQLQEKTATLLHQLNHVR